MKCINTYNLLSGIGRPLYCMTSFLCHQNKQEFQIVIVIIILNKMGHFTNLNLEVEIIMKTKGKDKNQLYVSVLVINPVTSTMFM
jgi:hypothetical protein